MLSHLAMHLYFLLISAIFWFVNLFKQRVSVPPPTDPLLFISATAAVQKIARKELTSSELIDAYIHRIKQINHLINAVVFDNFDAARKDAAEVDGMIVGKDEQELNELVRSKPLLGIPFTVKDAIEVEGMVITCGIYSQRHNVASRTAEAVMRLREAGGILLAITNVSEACLWTETSNGIYGRTKNPYDVRRSAGGSSGGEGALIGAAAGLIGVGCDVGGSIRIPAFMNGIFGMLTTPGVISIDGCIPPPKGYQCQMQRVGPMCRYAEDIALLVKAMASEETNCLNICSSFDHKKIRIFYMEGFRDMLVSPELSNDMKNALKRAVSHLEEKYDVDAVRIDLPLFMHAIDIISSCFSGHGRPSELMLSIHRDKGPVDWRSELPRLLMGRSVHSPGGVFTAMFEKKSCAAENESSTSTQLRDRLIRQLGDLLGDSGVLLFPSWPTTAPYHHQHLFTPYNSLYTGILSTLAFPVVQCPTGLGASGLPTGVQVVAAPFSDRLIIAVAEQLSEAFGGWISPGCPLKDQ